VLLLDKIQATKDKTNGANARPPRVNGRRMDISVVVATKDSARFLEQALASIVCQKEVSIDLIVVDAHSTDNTAEISKHYGARLIKQSTGGLARAWNLGVAAAKAPVVGFLDSDDRWVPETLKPRLEALHRNSNVLLSHGMVRFFLEAGSLLPAGVRRDLFDREFLSPIPGTLLVRREVFLTVGSFCENYRIAADVDWFCRALTAGQQVVPVELVVLEKRIHGNNLSLINTEVNNSELLRCVRSKIRNQSRSYSTH
jgi:glycosyltransferase involved in cell wall biosynthesis